mmetsp:Transcript_20414/g.57499  ORF Transcript_20414/g.57499 Transcript_20414/m.57499 type:complete len:132 (-) Transcript_20414:31-426(-)|eukprot:CAMPEP_0119155332 /NCGR_PEP_ID=MMETSP1310-20130426/51691_1 /TAXON_ID=464262 /ORGANISM="Genus nov. species nov., Strain RCC2339" /LENGTH=131 /DNA_ID=CAMNT_0007147927 /DNA_START=70 /DNA_END=465 /DNA_ORIENTATION=+
MADSVTVRTRKFMTNPLLQRKQFVVEVLHSGQPGLSKEAIGQKIAKMYNIDNPNLVVLFGFRTQFGGGRTSGFGLIYDNLQAAKKFEPRYRLLRSGAVEKVEKESRKLRKEKKNRAMKKRGLARAKILYGK